jgi:hypothetical protein
MVSNLTRTKRTHYEIQRQVRDAEERIKRAAGQNSAQIVRIKTAMDKATQMLKVRKKITGIPKPILYKFSEIRH